MSYVVLGLVESCEPATPYALKRAAERSVFHFWSVPHTQVYSECARLAAADHLTEQREEYGRRRRIYTLTDTGRAALNAWRAEPASEAVAVRDPGLVKLFFGADPGPLAEAELAAHRAQLQEYEQLHATAETLGMRLATEAGIGHEREFVRFWSDILSRSRRRTRRSTSSP
jgi:DNA-binding PadR family transcriptional regulator